MTEHNPFPSRWNRQQSGLARARRRTGKLSAKDVATATRVAVPGDAKKRFNELLLLAGLIAVGACGIFLMLR